MRRFPSLRGGGRGKKATSEESSRGMNANENDFKSGGRINTKLNTQGNYDGLRGKGNVLIYVAREAITAQTYQ